MAAQAVLNHQIWRWLGLGDRLASNPAATATAAASTFTSSANATASSAASQAAQATSSSLGLWAHAKQSVSSGATFVVDGVRTALWDTDGLYQAQEAAMYTDGRVPSFGEFMDHKKAKQAAQVPSLGTFLTSWYCIALVFIAFVVNRIHHIVPHVRRQNFRLESASYLGLRLPALALLGKSIAQVFAKAAELSTLDSRWLNVARVILPDVSSTPDATIMWSVFLSLAIACLAEAFVRALNNDPRHHPSFNMLSVSYLLHFHSTPASDPFLRPTPVVYLLIGLTLSEVWTLQMIDTFQLQARLAVTAFFSIFGQSTMVYLLYSTTHSNLDPVALNAILPALRHLTRLSELVFFGISLVTIAVHAAAQLAVEHRITSDIFGRAARLPTRNDDFSLAVIVYGAACLETTHASGLSNEVAPLLAKVDMPYIELANGAPTAITDSSSHNSQSIFMADVNYAYPSSQLRGLQTEVTDVRARALHPDQAPNPMSRTSSLVREAGRLCIALSNILLDILRLCCFTLGRRFDFLSKRAKGPGRIARALRFMGVRDEEMPIRFRTRRSRQATPARHVDVVESDSEDEDFVLRADSNSASDSEEDGSEGTDGDQDEDEDEGREDSFVLYTDFMQEEQEGESPEDLNKVMVAHMAGPAHRRLTRAQFQQLAAVPTAPTRPQAPAGSIDTSRWENLETQLVCIVCRADARSIICWPCRCLAMCEGCKDVLATTSHSSNSCPTCRQPVQGYSRIFVA